ncbi:S8 family serine peptidase [Algoriphagus sp. CAU 1675]|uniref:S8 family peptidase n=1 Tax=Algoriphagus sp. CAU 1675 TaxID=3032597 RepID=UPI0023DBE73A|nr:S8 family serine peptidase [Algoriphagus sp. CAU 1675]MDF2156815.1 S8 family serine peptidase [Algoriphagus sp. CAU 1675]
MKYFNLPFLLVFLFVKCSCSPDGKPVDEPISALEELEIIFKDTVQFRSLKQLRDCEDFQSGNCKGVIQQLKAKVSNELKHEFSLDIDKDQLLIKMYSGQVSVLVTDLNASQKKGIVEKIDQKPNKFGAQNSIDIQGRRPMMQAAFIEQGRRPMMQEQLRYDSSSSTSKYIQLIRSNESSFPNKNTKVWIIDTGVDTKHPDINSVVDSLSISFAKNASDPFVDESGHGTFIAGIIGANSSGTSGGGYHMNGVYPGANLVSVKVFDKQLNTTDKRVELALEHVLFNGSPGDIVNLSLGKPGTGQDLCSSGKISQAIEDLVDAGIYVVMSAGNDAEPSEGNFPGCINYSNGNGAQTFTVGSVEGGLSGQPYLYSFFSNFDNSLTNRIIDFVEPGEYIFTTAPMVGGSDAMYTLVSGTSFSAAIFSGILYHDTQVGILDSLQRGAVPGNPDPYYFIGKVH